MSATPKKIMAIRMDFPRSWLVPRQPAKQGRRLDDEDSGIAGSRDPTFTTERHRPIERLGQAWPGAASSG
jgi:hypothetical protein